MRYKDEVNRVIREDGKIISALQMIPYPMTFCDEVISTSYISGACTHPDYRKHGAMKRLLKETHRCMYEDGSFAGFVDSCRGMVVRLLCQVGICSSFWVCG